ncbi:hypothetical protein [Streptomyces sp. 900105755]
MQVIFRTNAPECGSSARQSAALFDQRLVRARCPRSCLALAKCTALLMVAVLVAVYTTAWMRLFWRPERLLVLAAGMCTGALIYGGIGIVLAAVLRSEPAGMVLAIMISSIDLVLQNPLINPDADSAVVRFLPAYGAVQTSVAAGGLQVVPTSCLLLGAGWAVGMAALGMAASAVRTRTRRSRTVQETPTDIEQAVRVP